MECPSKGRKHFPDSVSFQLFGLFVRRKVSFQLSLTSIAIQDYDKD